MAQLKSTNITGNLAVTGNTLASKIIKLGGTNTEILLANGDTLDVPSAGLGTVTSVGISVPTGLTVSNSPITSSGTINITFTSGYSIPTTAKQTNWDTAYGWGDHSAEGYLTAENLETYVQGPDTATSNAIARYNGATGKLIKDSTATIDDSGNLKITGSLYVPEEKYAYFGTDQLASFRANQSGAFIVGAYGDIYFRGNLQSNNSSSSASGIQISKTYLKPEITNTMDLGASDKIWKNVYAAKFVTNGSSNQFIVLGDGTTKPVTDFEPAGNYVTIDTEQTITGKKTFTGNVITSNNKFEIKASSNNDDSWIKLTNATDAGYYAFGIRRPYDTYGLQLKVHPASGSDSYYDIWHAGNQGAGSGLDADKLDGQEGSYYRNYNNLDNKPTIPNPADYYWANVQVSATSSKTTEPIFKKVNIAEKSTLQYNTTEGCLEFVFA